MPRARSANPRREKPPERIDVRFQVDVDPLMDFINRIVRCQEKMARGEFSTVEQAAAELGKVLAMFEGEQL